MAGEIALFLIIIVIVCLLFVVAYKNGIGSGY